MMEESNISISDIKEKYFEMCEIILNDAEEDCYQESKSEYLKFIERDYQDIDIIRSKIENETGKEIKCDEDIKNYISR